MGVYLNGAVLRRYARCGFMMLEKRRVNCGSEMGREGEIWGSLHPSVLVYGSDVV